MWIRPCKLSPQELHDLVRRHNELISQYGEQVPKHHMWVHMVVAAVAHGTPFDYDCFRDESQNKLLKSACRWVHQMHFEQSILHRMAHLLKRFREPE